MLRRKLTAAALAAVTVATLAWIPAEAGQTPNGLRVNGLRVNGAAQAGTEGVAPDVGALRLVAVRLPEAPAE